VVCNTENQQVVSCVAVLRVARYALTFVTFYLHNPYLISNITFEYHISLLYSHSHLFFLSATHHRLSDMWVNKINYYCCCCILISTSIQDFKLLFTFNERSSTQTSRNFNIWKSRQLNCSQKIMEPICLQTSFRVVDTQRVLIIATSNQAVPLEIVSMWTNDSKTTAIWHYILEKGVRLCAASKNYSSLPQSPPLLNVTFEELWRSKYAMCTQM